MKIRFLTAFVVAKLSKIVLKVTRHKATSFPGFIAYHICWDFLRYLKKPDTFIAVTGTNGKTTVSNMIADFLKADGKQVVSNSQGSNMIWGILSILIDNMTIFGNYKKDTVVIELDECNAKVVLSKMTPDCLIITNLSTDTVMRSAHPEHIAKILNESIDKNTKLVINGDDLITANIAPFNERVFFGLGKMEDDDKSCSNLLMDVRICPKCASLLEYEYIKYHHIGKAYCSKCGFKSPKNDYNVTKIDKENMTISVSHKGNDNIYKIQNESIYNVYNSVAAIACLSEMGYTENRINELLQKVTIKENRFEIINVCGFRIIMQMAKGKNPVSTSQPLHYVESSSGQKEVILMQSCVGDAKHWSENICWIYDTDFELLNKKEITNIICACSRGKDYYLRMLLAGIDEKKLIFVENEDEAVQKLKLDKAKDIYILYDVDLTEKAVKMSELIKQRIELIDEEEGNSK